MTQDNVHTAYSLTSNHRFRVLLLGLNVSTQICLSSLYPTSSNTPKPLYTLAVGAHDCRQLICGHIHSWTSSIAAQFAHICPSCLYPTLSNSLKPLFTLATGPRDPKHCMHNLSTNIQPCRSIFTLTTKLSPFGSTVRWWIRFCFPLLLLPTQLRSLIIVGLSSMQNLVPIEYELTKATINLATINLKL